MLFRLSVIYLNIYLSFKRQLINCRFLLITFNSLTYWKWFVRLILSKM